MGGGIAQLTGSGKAQFCRLGRTWTESGQSSLYVTYCEVSLISGVRKYSLIFGHLKFCLFYKYSKQPSVKGVLLLRGVHAERNIKEKMAQDHGKTEVQIFEVFAQVCPLPINLGSIEKQNAPKPDILCEIKGIGKVAFELTELIDENYARQSSLRCDTERALRDFYRELPQEKSTIFDNLYKDSLLMFFFDKNISLRNRKKIFGDIFDLLLALKPGFEGDIPLQGTVKVVVNKKNIHRGMESFPAPTFHVPSSGSVGDPTRSTIGKKFRKVYESQVPIELLAYIDRNPMFPEKYWRPRLHEFVKETLRDQSFERVWVFDLNKKQIVFSCAK